MRAWLISRQQAPASKQNLPQFSTRKAINYPSAPGRKSLDHDDLDEDAPINVEKRIDVVPLRRRSAEASDDHGFWSSHLFWKGIVFGVLAVIVIKTILDIRAPFGVDWYGF